MGIKKLIKWLIYKFNLYHAHPRLPIWKLKTYIKEKTKRRRLKLTSETSLHHHHITRLKNSKREFYNALFEVDQIDRSS